jgi:hypothetical protein
MAFGTRVFPRLCNLTDNHTHIHSLTREETPLPRQRKINFSFCSIILQSELAVLDFPEAEVLKLCF